MQIIKERPGDVPAIWTLVRAAFTGGGHESDIVERLRGENALTLSLVAIEQGEIVGHIAFSPIRVEGRDEGWLGLGPLAVRPDRQRSGIGSTLVRHGLALIEDMGASGCMLLGSPVYYGRFGFTAEPGLTLPGFPPHHFQCLPFGEQKVPQGKAAFHTAFDP